MNFWKLKKKHKRLFIAHKLVIFIALIVALVIAWNVNKIELPTNTERLKASSGFIITLVIFGFAVMNRISILFKIRSMGFFILALLFETINLILIPVKTTLWLLLIPLLIDDIIFGSIWKNIWYNEYDGRVVIDENK